MQWDIVAECVSTVFLCILWIYSRRSNLLPTLKNKLFQICFLTTFCAMVSNIIATLMIYNFSIVPIWLNWLVNTIYFIATPLMGVAYFYYAISIIYENQPCIPKCYLLSMIPAGLYLLIVIVNPITKQIFDINSVNGYVKGPWIILTYAIFYLYCLACLVVVLLKNKLLDSSIRRILTAFPLIAFFVIVIQQIFSHVVLSGTAATCALLLIYLYLQNKQFSIDHMLKIPNRQEFLDTLELHIKKRNNEPLFLVVISLREFKQINDKYGKQSGDNFLKVISSYLQQLVRPYCLYRFNGDEFAILLPNDNKTYVEDLVNKLYERMNAPWIVGSYSCKITAAVGVVQYPEIANTMEDIINAIEYSIAQAKSDKSGKICFCTSKLLSEVKRRNKLIEILRDALEHDKFEVYFQPIWSVEKKSFILAESLLRLTKSPLGSLYPSEFIPVAEDTGMIVEMTYQVLNKVCHFIHKLINKGVYIESVTVNFSGVQFSQPELSKKVLSIIEKNEIPFDKIKIEITESVLAENPQEVESFIDQMHKNHIQIGLDDFGTGYCNLVSVMDMPLDVVKLDKSLLWSSEKNEKSAIMMRNLTRIVRELGMRVVSEGVETKKQADFVEDCGCDWIQGFYYAKPMPENEAFSLMVCAAGKEDN